MSRQDKSIPQQRHRSPDSIWERYLTGRLSIEDKETLPDLVKEVHREIVAHLGQIDAANQAGIESIDMPPQSAPDSHRQPPSARHD